MPTLFERIADNRRSDSLAAKLRKKRAAFFEHLIETLEKPIRILDVGGTENYWQLTGLSDIDGVKIVLMNMNVLPAKLPNFVSVVGDARKLCYPDQSFDVVFSNSVIEHVGGFLDQAQMAEEIRRVGRGYFIQTPNKYSVHAVVQCFSQLYGHSSLESPFTS
jgi:Methyltransferase domain.